MVTLEQLPTKNDEKWKHIFLGAIILAFCIHLFIFIYKFFSLNQEVFLIYVLILLIIPLIIHILILFKAFTSSSIYYTAIAMAIPYIMCLIAFDLYPYDIFPDLFLSWSCLIAASLTMAMAFITTWAIMSVKNNNANSNSLMNKLLFYFDNLAKEIGKKHFLMICVYLMAFISITYLISFSIAFHDKFERKKGNEDLHYPALGSYVSGVFLNERRTQRLNFLDQPSLLAEIKFARGSAIIDEDNQFNKEQLDRLINRIRNEFNRKDTNRKRIVLQGHCSKENVSEGSKKYSSNYELSEARARQVKRLLLNNFDNEIFGYNIDWEILPMSHEYAESGEKNQNNWRCVKIFLELFSPQTTPFIPSLLDYMYFTIYTITTTGYGDIIPITPYAKFITSIANIFEVFFLVILFNVLLTYGSDQTMKQNNHSTINPLNSP